MADQYRSLVLRGATGKLRTASFRTREHLVVPVVALVEGVIQAVNADVPEFVPAEVIRRVPAAWNNRAVVGDHPVKQGTQVSANSPEVLEQYQFGHIFNAEAPEDRLIVEAWIDESLIRTGTVAEQVVRRLKNGEVVEVSVGAFVFTEKVEGTFKGLKYYAKWTEIIPDHLAMLNENDTGACSVEMGCGALRSNKAYLVTASGLVEETTMNKCSKCGKEISEGEICAECVAAAPSTPEPLTLRQKLVKMFSFRSSKAEDLTSSDLSNELDRAIRAIEPGYQGVLDILLNQNKVVYVVAPEDSWKIFQRSYSVDDDGAVEIANDAEEVRMVNRYEPVAASSRAAAAAPCGCHNKTAQTQSGEATMNKTERIAALIAAGTYKDTDKPWLEAMPDTALEALAKSHEAPAPAPAPATLAAAPAPAPVAGNGGAAPQTAEQFFSTVSDPVLRESLQDGYRASQEKRASLITALKATGRNRFSDEQLTAMSTQQLEGLAALAQVPAPTTVPANYTLRGVPPAEPPAEDVVEAPPSLVDSIRTAAGKPALVTGAKQ